MYSATSSISPKLRLDASIKKRFFNDKLVLMAGVYNITNSKDRFKSFLKEYTTESNCRYGINSRHYKFTLSYIFKSGKDIKKKSIENNSSKEIQRVDKSNQKIGIEHV